MSKNIWTNKWSWSYYIAYVREGFWTWLFAWVLGLHGVVVFLPSTYFAWLILGPGVPGAWGHGFTIAMYSLVASTMALLLVEAKWSWSKNLFGEMLPAGFMIGLAIEAVLSVIWVIIRGVEVILDKPHMGPPQFEFSVVFSIVVIALAFIRGLIVAFREQNE